MEGDEPSPRKRGQSDDTAIADRVRAQQEAVEIQRKRLRQERSIADSNYRWHVAEEEKAQHDLRAAIDSGDTERQVEAQTRIGRLSHGKEEARKNLNAWQAQAEPEQYTERTMRWFAEHPEFQSGALRQKAVGAHHICVGEGLTPDSDAYFTRANEILGLSRGSQSRSNGGSMRSSDRGGGDTVRLSKGEVERANDGSVVWNVGNTDAKGEVIRHGDPRVGKPVGNYEYARRKKEQISQGLHNKLG